MHWFAMSKFVSRETTTLLGSMAILVTPFSRRQLPISIERLLIESRLAPYVDGLRAARERCCA
jgi:hypothetical protein